MQPLGCPPAQSPVETCRLFSRGAHQGYGHLVLWNTRLKQPASAACTVKPAGTVTTSTAAAAQQKQRLHDQHDVQQLPAPAASVFAQLRRDSAVLSAAVQHQQQLYKQRQQQVHPKQQRQHEGRHQQQVYAQGNSAWHVQPKIVRFDPSAAALTQQLKSASTWQELQQSVSQYEPTSSQDPQQQGRSGLAALSPQLVSRLLNALVRCEPPAAAVSKASGRAVNMTSSELYNRFTQDVFSHVLQLLPEMQPREVSNILWAAAKLQQPPNVTTLRRLLSQMTNQAVLTAANAQDLSMCLYAVATLGMQVAEQQLGALLDGFAKQLTTAAPQAIANTLWAVAVLQYRPTEQWLDSVEQLCSHHLQQQAQAGAAGPRLSAKPGQLEQQPGFNSKGLHQLLWAMAKLQWVPNAPFLSAYWTATSQQLSAMAPHGTTGILWAATTLGLQPPECWVHTWYETTALQMKNNRFRDLDMANALWAVVRLGLKPCGSWLQQSLATAEGVLGAAGAQELSVMLWGFAKLGVRPPAGWMQRWLNAMYGRMSSYCAPSLSCSAYTLALLRFRPPRPWLELWVAETQHQMAAFGAQELSNIMWALATLGLKPNRAWFRDFEAQALHESSSFNGQELTILCWAMAKVQHTPPPDWLATLLRDGLEVQSDFTGQSVTLLMSALARFGLHEFKERGRYRMLLPRYWAATEPLLQSCTLWQLSELWYSRSQLGSMPTRAWSRSFWAAVVPQLSGPIKAAATARVASTAASGSAVAGQHAGCEAAVLSAASRQLSEPVQQPQEPVQLSAKSSPDPGHNASSIVSLISATGKMPGSVPQEARQLLMAAAEQVLPSCSLEALTTLGIGLVRMHRSAAAAASAMQLKQQRSLRCNATHSVLSERPARQLTAKKPSKSAIGRQVQQHAQLWHLWFARSTELLQQVVEHQPQAFKVQQQQQPRPSRPQHPAARQAQLHLADIASAHLCQQLFIAGQLAPTIRPPTGWEAATMAAVAMHIEAMSVEQLSWVLWGVRKLRLHQQLPAGWPSTVLHTCSRALQERGDIDAVVMSRLHAVMKWGNSWGLLSASDWGLWGALYAGWGSSRGLVVYGHV